MKHIRQQNIRHSKTEPNLNFHTKRFKCLQLIYRRHAVFSREITMIITSHCNIESALTTTTCYQDSFWQKELQKKMNISHQSSSRMK